jgi:hypothetical protein
MSLSLVNFRYAVVDLATGDVEERDLPEDYVSSGTKMFSHVDSALRDRGDAIAIGSGLATASFIPAACGGFIRRLGDAPSIDRTCPLTGSLGVELKLTGFDFIVLEEASEEPGYIWVRDGIVEFVPSLQMAEQDSWERTDSIRTEQGDRRIQVVSTGYWGGRGLSQSQLVTNYWGGEDKKGFAAEFGRRNLLAVAFRGMGEIEIDDPEGHFMASKDLQARHLSSLGRSSGLASFTDAVSVQAFADLRHRDVACFGCPYPCRTFYKTAEDPRTMTLESKEPGYLVYDIPAVERLVGLGMSARDVVAVLTVCAKQGAEPLSVIGSLQSRGQEVSLSNVLSAVEIRDVSAAPADTNPAGAHSSFSDDSERSMMCIALGLCPRYWGKVGFDFESLSEALKRACDALSAL